MAYTFNVFTGKLDASGNQSANDFDISDLADSENKRAYWDNKADKEYVDSAIQAAIYDAWDGSY